MPYVSTNGTRLFYHEQRAGGPPLVFVHGFACTHEDWQAQVGFFQSKHRVIACDLPGHGASEPPPDQGSVESLGAAVASLLDVLELSPAVLIGHSMGCRVVIQATLNAPERVAKLILLDGSCVGANDPQEAEQQTLQHIANVGYRTMVESLFEAMFVEGTDPALKDRIIQRAHELPEAVGTPLFSRLVGWDAGKVDAALAQIKVPTYVLQSTYFNTELVRVSLQPGEITPWMERVQQAVPMAELDVISGVGHFPMLEVPDVVNEKMAAFISK
ncbi:alpha/beta fold hydrolase [Candidatus Entotheonella palauensis]|uniref:alpha/beta fold hydrolase n=1 Tax=Candidatus Entotheonella palauensis TaxID=93172 RepID=UPI000B7CCE30|nr:alpha/beta hydrolase [Candidatus Entotheonella palauensis]